MNEKLFTKIDMFKCKYCERVFKTNNRHKCKFNPVLKNCYSCKHLRGIASIKIDDNNSDNTFDEVLKKEVICECGHNIKLRHLAKIRYALNCNSWACLDDYEGKDTYIAALWACSNSSDL